MTYATLLVIYNVNIFLLNRINIHVLNNLTIYLRCEIDFTDSALEFITITGNICAVARMHMNA